MPVWITLSHDGADVEVSTKTLSLPGTSEQEFYVEFEEEIDEGIVRHIWDAEPSGVKALKGLFTKPKPVNAIELGCGVGIFGRGLSVVFPRTLPPPSRRCTILMTDLEEAESRTRSNMSRFLQARQEHKSNTAPPVKFLYENLDWEQGQEEVFGPGAQSHRWDPVLHSDRTYNVDMLPALLRTLSALHESNTAETGEHPQSTKAILATKPRHVSEEALFGLLSDQGWTELHRQTLPLPVLGAETQCMELYLYKKA
ncbi:hypothetical protein CFAM422_008150 [Trichoderma lentiforme]|uniref:Methyltransferase n=1 Tax=Trichoderma lentiforme TaxID=1567552 RepID=A0A9P5CA23_9HYPO|nr:hypothetical protein CFAM422_008150 [Trichoderma lentiforme]